MSSYFIAGSVSRNNAYFGEGSESILASGVGCSGIEEALLQCPSSPTGILYCYHYNDAGVQCVGKHYLNTEAVYIFCASQH